MELKSTGITVDIKKEEKKTRLDEWREYKNEHGTDYILDRADELMKYAGDDPEIKAGVYTEIVKLLFEYPKEFQREFYIKALGRRFKPMKIWKDEYKAQKELHEEELEAENAPSPDADTTTLEKLGFYTEENKYWFATQSGFVEGTNFVIEPLFHIYSMTNNRRLIRITNEYEYTMLCDVPSDAMVSVEKFQSFLFSEGNFLVFINNNQFKKLLRYIGEKFPKCFEIKTFGWQPEGFWAWADGAYNGTWTEVDEMGIMHHSGKNYFSPAFSEVYSDLRQDDDVYENDRRFVCRTSNVTLQQWADLMQRVYKQGNNGMYAIAYLASALFRSEIYNLYKIFPHLFLHGEKGSGKSQMAWSLSNVFQQGTPPFNLSAGTDVAFFRWLARYRDVVIWYDEYTDNVDEKRFQALKSAYDGVGREKGKMSRDSRTESDKINSAAVISGQHLPQRDDNSLYTRSVVRFFVKPKNGYGKQETKDYDTLKRMEENGLSQVIHTLLNQRHIVTKKFGRVFSDMFEYYKEKLVEKAVQVEDRILRNYTILASMVQLFQNETPVDLRVNHEVFRDLCLQDAIEQNEKVSSSDALGTFWKMLGSLIQEGKLTMTDYDLQEKWHEKKTFKRDGDKDTEQINFERETWVLYLDFDRAYQKYMEAHRMIFGTTGLGLQTMMDYTHNHWSYLGLKGSHHFAAGNGKRTSAHMFNYTELVEKRVMPDFKGILSGEDFDSEETDNSWMDEEKKPDDEQSELNLNNPRESFKNRL
jgi:DNA primase